MKRLLFSLGFLFLLLGLPTCEEDNGDDALADLECNDLIDEIYERCERRLPMWEGDYPDADRAVLYCRQDERYDWACIDECVFVNKRLCTSLQMCLEDCPLTD